MSLRSAPSKSSLNALQINEKHEEAGTTIPPGRRVVRTVPPWAKDDDDISGGPLPSHPLETSREAGARATNPGTRSTIPPTLSPPQLVAQTRWHSFARLPHAMMPHQWREGVSPNRGAENAEKEESVRRMRRASDSDSERERRSIRSFFRRDEDEEVDLEADRRAVEREAQERRGDFAWLERQQGLNTPWHHADPTSTSYFPDDARLRRERTTSSIIVTDGANAHKKQRTWWTKTQVRFLNNPFIPLAMRSVQWLVSLLALAFAANAVQLSKEHGFDQRPSAIMAIAVDGVALIYLIYITWDEYKGKPLGLRSPKVKMRLVMLDLLFIIFLSANLALAFDTLFDNQWGCRIEGGQSYPGALNTSVNVRGVCRRMEALAAFLFLGLVGWVAGFTVSVFRIVERVVQA
ncbi:hypothetical protein YB2330_002549 [Saitoella coloradoensis]